MRERCRSPRMLKARWLTSRGRFMSRPFHFSRPASALLPSQIAYRDTRCSTRRQADREQVFTPPLFLHEPGRFKGTQVETSRLDGCRQTLDVERVRPQTTRRQSVTETRSTGFDSLRLHHCHCMRSVSAVPASSKVACGSAPAAEQARTSEEVQERPARRFGSLVSLSAGHAYASLATARSSFGDNGGGGDGAPQRLISAWSSLRSTMSSRPHRVFTALGHLIANEGYDEGKRLQMKL